MADMEAHRAGFVKLLQTNYLDIHSLHMPHKTSYMLYLHSTTTPKKKQLFSSVVFPPVAAVDTLFLATISSETISISDQEPIIFDTAPINPGSHYNTVLGAYTAPSNGYYQ